MYDKTACFTGHRPSKLDNCYSFENPMSQLIHAKLKAVITELVNNNAITRFISGGALGVDQIGFWAVERLKVRNTHLRIDNIVAIPFEYQYIKWKDKETLYWYHRMLEAATEVINVEYLEGYKDTKDNSIDGYFSREKMQKRNEFMVDKSKHIIAVWDGSTGGTGNCIKYAKSKKGHIIYRLNPKDKFKMEVYNT